MLMANNITPSLTNTMKNFWRDMNVYFIIIITTIYSVIHYQLQSGTLQL